MTGSTGTRLTTDVVYKAVNGEPILLDILQPEPTPETPMPAIVEIHGGGWTWSEKDASRNRRLVQAGFFTASINYRYAQEMPFPAQIEDCRDAVRWLRGHAAEYNIDAQRIGVWGHSAGGHLSALLGTMGEVQAVVDICGPTDMAPMAPYTYAPGGTFEQLFGGPLNEHAEPVRQANPITHIRGGAPPFLIIHAKDDRAMPFKHSVLLHEALKKAGVDTTLLLFEDGGHYLERHWSGDDSTIDCEMLAFFQRHLGSQ